MKKRIILLGLLAVPAAVLANLGYNDTPLIPGTKWHIHDGDRPQPPIVTPGTESSQEKAGTAPSDATVLFDGKDLSQWKTDDGGAPKWKIENGYTEINHTGEISTKAEFGPDVQLHVEWMAPLPAVGDGQARGNSGIFLFGRYETQVLDNYNNPTYPDGQATSVYAYMPPEVNACRPPGTWQTYDIIFEAPRFKDEKLVKPAYVTVLHNGVVTQNHTALLGDTVHRTIGVYHAHPEKGPIKIQDHGDPVRYRSIWIRELHMPTAEDIGAGPQIGK